MKLAATKREITGRKVKNLRAEGFVPAAIFGPSTPSMSISVNAKEFAKVFGKQGYNKFIELDIEGESKPIRTLVKNVTIHPLKDYFIDISLYAVDEGKKIKVEVPVEIVGESPAVKQKIGFLVTPLDSISVYTLPKDLPDSFVVDISEMVQPGDSILIRDLDLPEGVEYDSGVDDSSAVVFIAAPQKEIVEEEPEVEDEEGEEGEGEGGEEGASEGEEKSEE